MCGKNATSRRELDNYNKEIEQKQQQENNNSSLSSSTVTAAEHINGSYHTFDKTSCALMFKKFMDIYGSNFPCDD